MSKPAILQIIPKLDTGGAERTTLDIAAAVVADGYTALVASEGGWLEPELTASGAVSLRLPLASKNPLTIHANIARLQEIIEKYKVDLVHARSRAPAWSGLYAARREGIPFVTTHHGIYNAKNAWKRRYNSVMLRGDAVIANSEWTAAHIRTSYSFLPKRIAVIPRGIDLSLFDPAHVSQTEIDALRASWGAGDDARVVRLPGRLTRWKGHLVLIAALQMLAHEGRLSPATRIVLAGDDQGRSDYTDELRSAVAKAGLDAQVILAGHITNMPLAYRASDIALSASTEPEAFGRVPAEAGAMGRAVIATDHGGAWETVLPGKSGILVPPGDAKALAEALADLLALPDGALAAMGAAGRAHVEVHFSVETMCGATLALYRDLLAGR